jgi:hypothetical protein
MPVNLWQMTGPPADIVSPRLATSADMAPSMCRIGLDELIDTEERT